MTLGLVHRSHSLYWSLEICLGNRLISHKPEAWSTRCLTWVKRDYHKTYDVVCCRQRHPFRIIVDKGYSVPTVNEAASYWEKAVSHGRGSRSRKQAMTVNGNEDKSRPVHTIQSSSITMTRYIILEIGLHNHHLDSCAFHHIPKPDIWIETSRTLILSRVTMWPWTEASESDLLFRDGKTLCWNNIPALLYHNVGWTYQPGYILDLLLSSTQTRKKGITQRLNRHSILAKK